MVFDWFQRRSAQPEPTPAESDPASPIESDGETPESSAVDELANAQSPEPEPEPEPSIPASQPTVAVVDEAAPTPTAAEASATADVDDDPLEWARQAYARLKAQQAAEAEQIQTPVAPQQPSPEQPSVEEVSEVASPESPVSTASSATPLSTPIATSESSTTPAPRLSLLEQAAAERQQRQQELEARATSAPVSMPAPAAPSVEPALADGSDQPQLGEFDDSFTWSAEVLAAQGRQADQVSLEEIDWLVRLRRGLEKTRQGFVTGLLDSLGDDPLTPEVVDDLEALLLRADAGVVATDQVMEALRKRLNEEVVDPSEGIRFLKEQLRNLLDEPIQASGFELLAPERGRLNIWLMVGVNGVGKTTTLGKLANLAVRSGYSAMIAAADTFRAAAVQQVEVWGQRSDVPVVSNPTANADPAAVVFDAIGAARSKDTDLLLVDTAGRLQTKHNLMEELQKIRRIVDRLAPESKVESLLVLDASQGQNGLKQALAFAKAADLTGVVITKLDGTSRGGVALAVSSEAGLPIRFIGAGEGIRDLRPFNSFEFVEALLAGR